MGLGRTARRRWIGAVVLAIAMGMLIAGQTTLQPILRGDLFFVYWLVCVVLTGVAIVTAFVDARETRTEIKKQERDLLQDTIKQIQDDARERATRNPRKR
jgi:hypothetical protein